MNVARLNFAHGTLESHRKDIQCPEKLNRSCMMLVEL